MWTLVPRLPSLFQEVYLFFVAHETICGTGLFTTSRPADKGKEESVLLSCVWTSHACFYHNSIYKWKLLIIQISLVGQPSPVKSNPSTPVKGALNRDASMVQEDFIKFYKDTGLEPLAREVRKLESPRASPATNHLFLHPMREQYKAYFEFTLVGF